MATTLAPTGQTVPTSPVLPSNSVLRLGAVIFEEDEHPSEISFPGTQMLATHQYIGGNRDVQVLGPQPGDVEWTGFLWEDRLAGRIATLAGYRRDGSEQQIQYLGESYFGIVKEFTPTYYSPYFAK